MTFSIDGVEYEIVFGSDVIRNGVYVELNRVNPRENLAMVFEYDADGTRSLNRGSDLIPAQAIDRLLKEADSWFRQTSIRSDANQGVVRYFEKQLVGRQVPDFRPPDGAGRDYMESGAHPDIVGWLWDQLGKVLPEGSRRVAFGSPALMNPDTRVIVAIAIGTQYGVRLPRHVFESGLPVGAKTQTTWSDGRTFNIQKEFGQDWILGSFSAAELAWCKQALNEKRAG